MVPADKKLPAEWIGSLCERGVSRVWEGDELRFIGMPVVGIGCGQLYMAGDGRLWLLDIFKSDHSREPLAGLKFELMTINGLYTLAGGFSYGRVQYAQWCDRLPRLCQPDLGRRARTS